MASLMTFSSSCFVFIRGIFDPFASCNNFHNVLLIYFSCYLQLGNKQFIFSTPVYAFFAPQKLHCHLNNLAYCIAGILRHCISTLQHIPEDDSFYFACIEIKALKPLCFAVNVIWKILTMEICLTAPFHIFSLPCIYLVSPFIVCTVSFSNNCNSVLFQKLLILISTLNHSAWYLKNIELHCIN